MSEIHQQQQQQQLLFREPRASANSRFGGVRSGGGGGEIVEVQGGHIVRSTGRKDRHSKVCTAKGPRDRRVRLSAHTAIQFYDVQDRLGYDRPSKALDWLIKNAKAAIDELAELPPWHPSATPITTTISEPSPPDIEDSGKKVAVHMGESASSSAFAFGGSSSFLPPSLESDAIADTIKFFFPIASGGGGGAITTAAAPSSSNPTGFHHYPPDLLSRSISHAQDLRLSLQSFQDPILLQHHPPHSAAAAPPHHTVAEQDFFDTTSANWSDQNSRIPQWGASDTGSGSSTTTITAVGGSYMFSMPQPQGAPIPLHPVLGQGPFLTQRGPLQSNNSPSILAWTDPTAAVAAMQHAVISSSTGFASGGFSGFHIPARIQGEEEHHDDVISGKPSSTAPRR